MQIHFLGAARTVTGSLFLLEHRGRRVLIDAGLFQGRRLGELNYRDLSFEPQSIDAVVITHAHLDHIGFLPHLVRYGLNAPVYSTDATRDLASIMLLDSAHLQEEEYFSSLKRDRRRGIKTPEPLYDVEDVVRTMSLFVPGIKYGDTIEPVPGLKVTFRDAGHILGSATLELEDHNGKRVLISGDLGNINKPIVRDPEPPHLKNADLLLLESTYGTRDHKTFEESVEEFKEAIVRTIDRGGNVVIPSFALERAQDILYILREFKEEGLLKGVSVFLDSPLAIRATEIFRRHRECFDRETEELFKSGIDPFMFPGLQLTRSVEASKKINQVEGGAIIIAGSGMCTGGRIKHHLKYNLYREECSIIFVGYQAKGTLGREIVDGKEEVNIYGETIKVRAEVYTINGFSAHAGKSELISWWERAEAKKTALIHGEEDSLDGLSLELQKRGGEIFIPSMGDAVEI